MTAKVDAKDLAGAVSHVMRAVKPNPNVPENAAVQMAVADGEMTLTGFDGHGLTSRARIPAQGELLPSLPHGAMLSRVVPLLSGDVAIGEGGMGLQLQGGRARFEVAVIDQGSYPRTPVQPPAVGTSIGFSEALNYVLSSASTDLTVLDGVLAGVHIETVDDGSLMLITTDRYRVSRAIIPWDGQEFSATVMARTLGEFARSMAGSAMTVHADANLLGLSSGALSVTLSLTDGVYPTGASGMVDNARAGALAEDGGVLIVAKPLLLDAIKTASAALDKNDPLILTLDAEGGSSVRSAPSGRSIASASYSLEDAFYDGPTTEVRLQSHYFESVVIGTPLPYVVVSNPAPVVSRGTERLQPVHVAGQASEDEADIDPRVQHIVMPLRRMG